MSSLTAERQGIHAVGLIVHEELGWIFREQTVADWGIDAQIEVVDQHGPTGRLIAAQIKAGEAYFKEHTNGFVYRGYLRHLEYWRNHSLPVILILYNPKTRQAYWDVVRAEGVHCTPKGWKMVVPETKLLTGASAAELLQLAFPSGTRSDVTVPGMVTTDVELSCVTRYLEMVVQSSTAVPPYYHKRFNLDAIRQRVRIRERIAAFPGFQAKGNESDRRGGYYRDDTDSNVHYSHYSQTLTDTDSTNT